MAQICEVVAKFSTTKFPFFQYCWKYNSNLSLNVEVLRMIPQSVLWQNVLFLQLDTKLGTGLSESLLDSLMLLNAYFQTDNNFFYYEFPIIIIIFIKSLSSNHSLFFLCHFDLYCYLFIMK